MPVFKLQRRVKARKDMVWRVISDAGSLAEVAPHISRVDILEGEGVGLRRRLYDRQGDSWIEECVAWDEGSSYTMRVDTSTYPFAFKKMQFTWSVEEQPHNVLIKMRHHFTPKYGALGRLILRLRFQRRFEETCQQLMESWIRVIHAREWAYNVTVSSILEQKGHGVISVNPDTTVLAAVHVLRKNRIGSVMVLEEDGSVAGVVSERDVVRGLGDIGDGVLARPCSDVMTPKVIVCHPEDNMLLVMACMSERRFRHLPVMGADDRLVGIISLGDVVKTRVAELEAESETLKDYIAARRWRELYVELGPAALATDMVMSDPD